MPRSVEWLKGEPTRTMVHGLSRYLNEQDSQDAALWMASQNFKGRVVEDCVTRRGDVVQVGGWFMLNEDLMMFKLAWG